MASPSLKRKLNIVTAHAAIPGNRSFVHGFLACFSIAELCEAAVLTLGQPLPLRTAVRSRIHRQATEGIGLQKIDQLGSHLLALSASTAESRRHASALLSHLYDFFSPPTRKAILEAWSDQGTRSADSRWLKAITADALLFDIDAVVSYWKRTGDERAAVTLVEKVSSDRLPSLLDELVRSAPGWIVSRAMLRVNSAPKEIWEAIRERIPATYAYLCARMGRAVSDSEALDLILKSDRLGDSGLAVWSVGQMGKWSVLVKASKLTN